MNLTEVLSFFGLNNNYPTPLKDICLNTRHINPGDLFLAIPGEKLDGREYILEALDKGCAAILAQAPYAPPETNVPIIGIEDLKSHVPKLSSVFYNEPSSKLDVIGITGTNGKTSTSHYIAQLFLAHNTKCALMGTVGNGLLDDLSNSELTTSDCCTIAKYHAAFVEQNIKYVAMEVSSHALVQNRLNSTKFSTAIFTNLSQDHMDYHANMHEYFLAKAKLFTEFAPKNCIVNIDDPYGSKLVGLLPNDVNLITCSSTNKNATIHLDNGILKSPWGSGEFKTSLIGNFNVANVLAALATCCVYGFDFGTTLNAIALLKPVAGRMQKVQTENTKSPMVIVDYAHTPDALAKVLEALTCYKRGKLYCIFGCGGDRDKTKRPMMLKAALEHSDKVVVTSDNPRTEDPQQIVADILSVNKDDAKVSVILDRDLAIAQTIKSAQFNDIVLIAGKGHEQYQIINHEKLPFCDVEIAQEALKTRSEWKCNT